MGVPVVRSMGSRLSHRRLEYGGPRLCSRTARPDAERVLSASERPDPCLRMELQRREPAGPRFRDSFQLRAGGTTGRGGCREFERVIQKALAELHMVGKPEGPGRQ